MKYSNQLATRESLSDAIELLSSTSGYTKLSRYRQKLMRVALIIQHRLDRQLEFGPPKSNYKYVKSIIFLLGINCFNSAWCVERGVSFNYNYHPKAEFFNGGYCSFPFSVHLQANNFISKVDFPSVVHIKGPLRKDLPYHSFIALGETKNREDIVIWEKRSNTLPYRVTTLSTIFSGYQNCNWAVRPFQTPR